jgi:hypothetical protein
MRRLGFVLALLSPGWVSAQDGTLGQVLAHSGPDWSTDGVQGEHGWHYGWYDHRADVERGDGRYSTAEFVPFRNDGSGLPTGANHWNGEFWELAGGDVDASVQLRASGGRPSASASAGSPVLWAVRRWRSNVEGEVEVEAILTNDDGGDGVVGRVFYNGRQLHTLSSDGLTDIFVASIVLAVGDVLDFALDADGSGNLAGAGIDHIDGSGDDCHQVLRVRRLRPPPGEVFQRGDSNGNGTRDITDAVRTLNWLFLGGPQPPCLDAADYDDDGEVDLSDPVRALTCGFWLGCDPPPPWECGPDPTPDFLPTCTYESC